MGNFTFAGIAILTIYNYISSSLALNIPSAAGSEGDIQYFYSGASSNNYFTSSGDFNYDPTSQKLSVTNISASNEISASSYIGDGSKLQNLPGGTPSLTSSATDFNIPGAYDIFLIDTNSNIVTGTLPLASSAPIGKIFRFKDVGGNCGVNNFVVEASGSDTIDGAVGVKIQVAFGSIAMFNDGSNYRILY